jgi:hypothetical protein
MAFFRATGVAGATIDHSAYDALLKKHVTDGSVDYALLKNDRGELDEYLARLGAVDASEFESWSREDRMALYINAYNAITLHGILVNYPIKPGGLLSRKRFPRNSIRQIGDFWDTAFVPVMAQRMTLNHMEHEVLRKQFKDPRIHFALVCASKGCPLLSDEAYRGAALDDQLDNDVRRFVNDESKVRIDTLKNELLLSSIFKWYSEDFAAVDAAESLDDYDRGERHILSFIGRFIDAEEWKYIEDRKPRIKYLPYDWSLNEKESR